MPPVKPYSGKIGDETQANYDFLERLFDQGPGRPKGQIRDDYLSASNPDLHTKVYNDLKLNIPSEVKIGVFDCETATFHNPAMIDPIKDEYYIAVLPPFPRRYTDKSYIEDQAMQDAWYHAAVDGYGM